MDETKIYGRSKSGNFRKRSQDQFDNAKRKRHNSSHDEHGSNTKPIDTIYRILCPVKKIGSVLGKGGEIVNALRDETHAKIRVADAIPGAEERVIIIFSYQLQNEKNDSDKDLEDKDANELESMRPHCPAQDALLKINDRIAADEVIRGGVVQERTEPDDVVTARILVPKNQVGCLLGKGGTIIQQLRSDTGANIRILPSDHLPPCSMDSDELVQVTGLPSVTKKALYKISSLLHQHPHKENPPLDDVIHASTHGSYRSESSRPLPLPQGSRMWSQYYPDVHDPPIISKFSRYPEEPSRHPPGNLSRNTLGLDGEIPEEFSIRILCATVKIGSVIGKGGTNVRQLEQQTGARIQVEDTAPDAEERVITISSKEVPWDRSSPTIEAVLQLQSKTSSTSEDGVITTRLLVPSSKVGCILGQGGNVITEMRRRTRADIRVYSKDDKPKYTSANEELVQISGPRDVAWDALAEIASRLRARTFRSGNNPVDPEPPAPFYIAPPERFPRRGVLPSENAAMSSRSGNTSMDSVPAVPFYIAPAPPERFPSRGVLPSENAAMSSRSDNTSMDPSPAVPFYIAPPERFPRRGVLPSENVAMSSRSGNTSVDPAPAVSFYNGPPERVSRRGLLSSENAAMSSSRHFRGYSPENYSTRGMPSSSMMGPGKSLGYDYPKGYEQSHEGHYYTTPAASGHTNYNPMEIPNSGVPSVAGADGGNFSDIRQFSGARAKLHEPILGASDRVMELHGTSDHSRASQSHYPPYVSSGGHSLPPSQALRPY